MSMFMSICVYLWWGVGIKLRYSARAVHALKLCATSPAHGNYNVRDSYGNFHPLEAHSHSPTSALFRQGVASGATGVTSGQGSGRKEPLLLDWRVRDSFAKLRWSVAVDRVWRSVSGQRTSLTAPAIPGDRVRQLLPAGEVTAAAGSAAVEPLPAAGRAEGVTKPQPLIQGNYFEDSDLNEESPRGSHTYPLTPFYMLLLAPQPQTQS